MDSNNHEIAVIKVPHFTKRLAPIYEKDHFYYILNSKLNKAKLYQELFKIEGSSIPKVSLIAWA